MTRDEIIKVITDNGKPYDQTLNISSTDEKECSSIAMRSLFLQFKGKRLAHHLILNECKRALSEELTPMLATRALYCLSLYLKYCDEVEEEIDVEALAEKCQTETLDADVTAEVKALIEKHASVCTIEEEIPDAYADVYNEYVETLLSA